MRIKFASTLSLLVIISAIAAGLPCLAQTQQGPVIACASRRQPKGSQPVIIDLVVMNADGSSRKTLWSIQGNVGSICAPSWSPDLDPSTSGYQGRIAYETSMSNAQPLWTVPINIDLAGNITSGTPEPVNMSIQNEIGALRLSLGPAVWSPDGKWLAFRARRDLANQSVENGMYAIPWLAGSGGVDPVHVADPPDGVPMGTFLSWDPTSTNLAYSLSGNLVKQQVVSGSQLIPFSTTGSNQPISLITNALDDYRGPAWSNTDLLAFSHTVVSGRKTVSYLYILPVPTTAVDISQLSYVAGSAGADTPTWSPDGSLLVYRNDRGFVRIDMATSNQITFGSSNDYWPNWRH